MSNINLANMQTEIKILGKSGIKDRDYKTEVYDKLCLSCACLNNILKIKNSDKTIFESISDIYEKADYVYRQLLSRYNEAVKGNELVLPTTRECDELNMVIIEIPELIERMYNSDEDENKLNVNHFICRKCFWSTSTTLIGAPDKCGNCGSKDYLERAVVVTKNGQVENPRYIKYNPDANKYKKHTGDVKLKEQLIMNKVKQINQIKKEEKEMETKTYVVTCTNVGPKRCGFAYETNDKPNGTHKHITCQRCGYKTSHQEKAPEKKLSKFDR